jgi:urease subunit beta
MAAKTKDDASETAAPASTGVGGYLLGREPIVFNANKPATTLKVRNTGDRPIQVGSHFHFFEVNRALEFDRAAAFGLHLNIPSSTAIRFEPGDERNVSLVPFGGKQRLCGFNNLVDGTIGAGAKPRPRADKKTALARARQRGFKTT